ncbi:MAG: 2-C-methyl-D-erythritol 2,4-cyclodiphosphate synthase [Candidatus Omnitrophica bacterium]|nr:2-C-methyl-D-erythritol 2,4-cyclodiphosphate synthase [Candidatus Omnitrophota bacterium]
MLRIGIGYDLHRLVKRRKLVLGGARIPFAKGLFGHSDADVLLHAICDALLGAAAQGDLGEHFPDTDLKYKNISSIKLLQKVVHLLKQLKYSIRNIDSIVVAEEPRLAPFKKKISQSIAKILALSPKQVSVKATTTEGLGPIGRGEAISAHAVVLIEKRK